MKNQFKGITAISLQMYFHKNAHDCIPENADIPQSSAIEALDLNF